MDDFVFILGMSLIPLGFIAFLAMHDSKIENFQKQAVQRGFAEYIQQNDKMEFKWKETSKN